MNILMVIGQFYPIVGGSERQCLKLSKSLVRSGHSVRVITLRIGDTNERETIDGVDVVRVEYPRHRLFGGRVGLGFLAPFFLFKALMQNTAFADVIHVHQAHWPSVVSALVSMLKKKPLICKLANSGERFDLRMLRKNHVYGWPGAYLVKRAVKTFVYTSAAVKEDLTKEGIKEKRLMYIPNGVEIPSPEVLRSGDTEMCKFIYTGTFTQKKNLLSLLRAISGLSTDHKNRMSLNLVGEGPEKLELEKFVEENQLGGIVNFPGAVDDVRPMLREADVFVLPSLTEGLSNSALEAMAHSLPLLLSRVGGNLDLINSTEGNEGDNGVFIDPNDIEGIRKAFRLFIENSDKRRRMSERSLEKANKLFSMSSVTSKYEGEYSKLKNKPARVVHLITYLDSQTGGMERQALQLAGKLRDMGHETFFITSAQISTMIKRSLPLRGSMNGMTVYRIPFISGQRKPNALIYIAGSLALLILLRGRYDVIHAHQVYTSGVAGALAKKLLRSKRLVVKNCCGGVDGDINQLKRLPKSDAIMQHMRDQVDSFVAISHETRREMEAEGLRSIVMVPNGVDIEKFSPKDPAETLEIRYLYNIKETDKIVFIVAKFDPQKNLHHLIEAMAIVDISIRLLIVGTGSLRGPLEEQVRALGLEKRVTFCGTTDRVELFYAVADVFVLPSRSEGMPNVLLEAMSTGLVSVGSDIDSITAIIEDNVTGYIFPEGDIQAFAGSIIHAVDADTVEMGKLARAHIKENYSIKHVANTYDKLYQSFE